MTAIQLPAWFRWASDSDLAVNLQGATVRLRLAKVGYYPVGNGEPQRRPICRRTQFGHGYRAASGAHARSAGVRWSGSAKYNALRKREREIKKNAERNRNTEKHKNKKQKRLRKHKNVNKRFFRVFFFIICSVFAVLSWFFLKFLHSKNLSFSSCCLCTSWHEGPAPSDPLISHQVENGLRDIENALVIPNISIPSATLYDNRGLKRDWMERWQRTRESRRIYLY